MSRIEEDFSEKSEAVRLIDDLMKSQVHYDGLFDKVSCHIDGDEPAPNVECALESAIEQGAKVFPVKIDDITWYFVAKDGADVLTQLRSMQ